MKLEAAAIRANNIVKNVIIKVKIAGEAKSVLEIILLIMNFPDVILK